MTDQLAFILTVQAPHVRGSDTSMASANAIEPHLNVLQARVLECIKDGGLQGRTDEQCQYMLAMNPSTQRPRRVELADKGLIRKAGFTRPTRSGRAAVVWCAS